MADPVWEVELHYGRPDFGDVKVDFTFPSVSGATAEDAIKTARMAAESHYQMRPNRLTEASAEHSDLWRIEQDSRLPA